MQKIHRPSASLLFIFGGSGDLNYRKLSPALYNLFLDEMMPEKFSIYGIARAEFTDETYRTHLLEGVHKFSRRKEELDKQWSAFSKNIFYLQMDAADEKSYNRITEMVTAKETEWGERPNVIFYMAVAPQLVSVIAPQLGKLDLCRDT